MMMIELVGGSVVTPSDDTVGGAPNVQQTPTIYPATFGVRACRSFMIDSASCVHAGAGRHCSKRLPELVGTQGNRCSYTIV